MSSMIIFLKETGIRTVDDLANRLSEVKSEIDLLEHSIKQNNQIIRDIDDFQKAIQDYRELSPIQEQLDKIHFKGKREAFQNEHADELKRFRKAQFLREKLSKKLTVPLPLDKAGAKKLKAQRISLNEQNESLRPKLGQIRQELDQLSKLRYWTRKAIPEALPENHSIPEQLETAENKRELEEIVDVAIEAVAEEATEKQPQPESPKQEKKHDQTL